jgi:hypothetical protein
MNDDECMGVGCTVSYSGEDHGSVSGSGLGSGLCLGSGLS